MTVKRSSMMRGVFFVLGSRSKGIGLGWRKAKPVWRFSAGDFPTIIDCNSQTFWNKNHVQQCPELANCHGSQGGIRGGSCHGTWPRTYKLASLTCATLQKLPLLRPPPRDGAPAERLQLRFLFYLRYAKMIGYSSVSILLRSLHI